MTSYIATSNSATGGLALNSSGSPAEVSSLIIGNPVANANICIYNETNPGGISNTTGLLAKLTLPASFATGQLPFVIDLTNKKGNGVVCPMGGNVLIDQSLQLTVNWDVSIENTQTN